MNKTTQNLFKKGSNDSIHLAERSNFSYRGNWLGVHNNTVMDSFHVGQISSAIYQITVEFDSNNKEILQLSVVARPDRASFNVYGRSSLSNDLINISVTVDHTICKVIVNPADTIYAGAKLIFHATYAETIHQLVAPSAVADTSTDTGSINTFDETGGTFDNTAVTFDRT